MNPNIVSVHREQILPGDVLLLTVSDMSIEGEESLHQNLGDFAEDADVYVLVMRDEHFKDFTKLSLRDLVILQSRVEEAIREISERDAKAEA